MASLPGGPGGPGPPRKFWFYVVILASGPPEILGSFISGPPKKKPEVTPLVIDTYTYDFESILFDVWQIIYSLERNFFFRTGS